MALCSASLNNGWYDDQKTFRQSKTPGFPVRTYLASIRQMIDPYSAKAPLREYRFNVRSHRPYLTPINLTGCRNRASGEYGYEMRAIFR